MIEQISLPNAYKDAMAMAMPNQNRPPMLLAKGVVDRQRSEQKMPLINSRASACAYRESCREGNKEGYKRSEAVICIVVTS